MFFRNLHVYRTTSQRLNGSIIENALCIQAYTPIGASQEISIGWEPFPDTMHFSRLVMGQMLVQFKIETRKVPGSALKAAVKSECDKREQQTGRKIGKKERREITEDQHLMLLPKVLPTEKQVQVWIDPTHGWIVINTPSQSVSDRIITALVTALDKLELQTLCLARSAGAVMTEWLSLQEGPAAFSLDRTCELKACDESKAIVRYTNSTLDTENLREHIKQGKVCSSLALTWNDRISFVLTDKFKIKKVKFLDVIQTERDENEDDGREPADADLFIMATELHSMLSELVEAFGGEEKREDKTFDESLF